MSKIRDTSHEPNRIDPKRVGKILGASHSMYLGNSKDPLRYANLQKLIAKMAAECDDCDEDPHDEPLKDD